MKKLLTGLLSLMLLFSLAACGGDGDKKESTSDSPTTESTKKAKTTKKTETTTESSEALPKTKMATATFKDVTVTYPESYEATVTETELTLVFEEQEAVLMIQEFLSDDLDNFSTIIERGEWPAVAAIVAAVTGDGDMEDAGVVDLAGGKAGHFILTSQVEDIKFTMDTYGFSSNETNYLFAFVYTDSAKTKYADVRQEILDTLAINRE